MFNEEEHKYKDQVHAGPLTVIAEEILATMIDRERVQSELSRFSLATVIRTFTEGNRRFFLVIVYI